MADAFRRVLRVRGERLDGGKHAVGLVRGQMRADGIQHAHLPGRVVEVPGFVAVLLPTVPDRHDRTFEHEREVEDDAREVGHHHFRAGEALKAVGLTVPADVGVGGEFRLELVHEVRFGDEALRVRPQDDVPTGLGQSFRNSRTRAGQKARTAPGGRHEHGARFGFGAVVPALRDHAVEVGAAQKRKILRRGAALRFEEAKRPTLMLARAVDGVVVVEAEELVAVRVGGGVNEMDVALDALGAPDLEDVDPGGREDEDVGLQEPERRVGAVPLPDVAGGDVRNLGLKDRIVFGGGEVRDTLAHLGEGAQHRLERPPVGGGLRVEDDAAASERLVVPLHAEGRLADERRQPPDEEVPGARQPDHDREQHAPRARIQIGVGILGRRPKERSRPKGGERRRARLCALGATGPLSQIHHVTLRRNGALALGRRRLPQSRSSNRPKLEKQEKARIQIRLNAGFCVDGVGNGTRTHDNRNHNPGLYQLSYAHHVF